MATQLPDQIIEQHELGFKIAGFLRDIFQSSIDGSLLQLWEVQTPVIIGLELENPDQNIRGCVQLYMQEKYGPLVSHGVISFGSIVPPSDKAEAFFERFEHDSLVFTPTRECLLCLEPIRVDSLVRLETKRQQRQTERANRICGFFASLREGMPGTG